MNSDPRVFFASERTLLAWLRTGIAIVGLGFIVSRFGLFLRLLSAQETAAPQATVGYSHFIGVFLVALGSLSMATAAIQHGRFIATLPKAARPSSYSHTWSVWLAGLVTLASGALGAFLALVPQ